MRLSLLTVLATMILFTSATFRVDAMNVHSKKAAVKYSKVDVEPFKVAVKGFRKTLSKAKNDLQHRSESEKVALGKFEDALLKFERNLKLYESYPTSTFEGFLRNAYRNTQIEDANLAMIISLAGGLKRDRLNEAESSEHMNIRRGIINSKNNMAVLEDYIDGGAAKEHKAAIGKYKEALSQLENVMDMYNRDKMTKEDLDNAVKNAKNKKDNLFEVFKNTTPAGGHKRNRVNEAENSEHNKKREHKADH